MSYRSFLTLGLKLLGVYFAVLGFTVLAATILSFLIDSSAESYQDFATEGRYFVISVLQPLGYLFCAVTLMRRTDWCLDIIHPMVESSEELKDESFDA